MKPNLGVFLSSVVSLLVLLVGFLIWHLSDTAEINRKRETYVPAVIKPGTPPLNPPATPQPATPATPRRTP